MADLKTLVEAVDHPNLAAMYDTHHSNIEEKSQSEALKTIAPYLKHIHISENDRSTPGAGNVNWEKNFSGISQIGYDGWMVIEAFGLALPELAAATRIWRRMFDTELKLAEQGLAFMKSQVAKYHA